MKGRFRGTAAVAISLGLLLLSSGAYLALIDWASGLEDFRFRPHQGRVVVLPRPTAARLTATIGPARLRQRLAVSVNGIALPVERGETGPEDLATILPELETGLHFVRFRADYMGGRRREAALPVAVGPFAGEDGWTRQALVLTLPQDLLWNEDPDAATLSRALGPAIADIVGAEISASAARDIVDSARVDDLRIMVTGDGLSVHLGVLVNEDSRVSVAGPLRFSLDREGEIAVAGGPYDVGVDLGGDLLARIRDEGALEGAAIGETAGGVAGSIGRLIGGLLGGVVGSTLATSLAEQRIRNEILAVIERRVPPLLTEALRFDRPVVLAREMDLGLRLRWSEAPRFEAGRGMRLLLDAIPFPGGPAATGVLPGAPCSGNPAPEPPLDGAASLSVSEDLINRLAYRAWSTGAIDALLSGRETIAAVNEHLTLLSVTVDDIRLDLPPVLRAGRSELAVLIRLRLTDGVGWFHATLATTSWMEFAAGKSRHEIRIAPRAVSAACVDGDTMLACYPDLVQIVSEGAALRRGLSLGIGDQIDRLGGLRLSPGDRGGIAIAVRGLEPSFVPGGVAARLRPEISYVTGAK